jgi:hypothetical protein
MTMSKKSEALAENLHLSLCTPQIPLDLLWDGTRAAVVESRRLTARATAQHSTLLSLLASASTSASMAAAIYRQQKVLSHFPVCCWIDWLLMIKKCLIESGSPCIVLGITRRTQSIRQKQNIIAHRLRVNIHNRHNTANSCCFQARVMQVRALC